MVTTEAALAGQSFSQFVRDAALVRAVIAQSQREGSPLASAMALHERLAMLREVPTPDGDRLGMMKDAVLRCAPAELNGVLGRLDELDPEAAAFARLTYGLSPGEFAPVNGEG